MRKGWTIEREKFGPEMWDWNIRVLKMINAHLREVRPEREPNIALDRYEAMQKEGRLIWIVARSEGNVVIGFSSHWWYRDLHFDLRVGHDDLWHVENHCRRLGIGRELKQMGLAELQKAGAVYTSDHLRYAVSNDLMTELGYQRYGTIWRKPLETKA